MLLKHWDTMYFKCSDLVLHNINYFPIAYVRFGFIKKY